MSNVNVDEFLAHYGIKGMKWGVINEEKDAEITGEKRGTVANAVHKVAAKIGVKSAQEKDKQRDAANTGIGEAKIGHHNLMKSIDQYKGAKEGTKEYEHQRIMVSDYLWEMRGGMSQENIYQLNHGDVDATKEVYKAAKSFDMLMEEYSNRSGTSMEENELFKSMEKDSNELDDLYNELKEKGVKYPEHDPEYYEKYKEVEENLDKYASEVCKTLGFPDEQGIRSGLKVLWFNTGYTNMAGNDPTDASQYGRRNERREHRKEEKRNKNRQVVNSEETTKKKRFWHSDDFEELPYLAHHGVKGQKWGIRRYQNPDGTLINPKRKDKPHAIKEWDYTSGTKDYKVSETRHLTDDELKKRVNRLTQENNYRDQLKKSREADISNRQKLINKIFKDSAANAAASVMQTVYTKAATNFLNSAFPALMGTEGSKKKKSGSSSASA